MILVWIWTQCDTSPRGTACYSFPNYGTKRFPPSLQGFKTNPCSQLYMGGQDWMTILPTKLTYLLIICFSYSLRKVSSQFSSVAQSCPTLWDPMNCSTPGLPTHHQLPEFTQIHVHWVGDAIQPSHPLLSSSPPAPNPSQHQGLSQWVNSLHEVAKYWSFSFNISPSNEQPGVIFRMDWLDLLAVQGTLESSPTPQFKSINSSVLSFLYSPTLTSIQDYWKNHNLD